MAAPAAAAPVRLRHIYVDCAIFMARIAIMAAYSVLEARNNLSRLISSVESGAEVTITRHGRPVARLVAVEPREPWTGASFAAWLADNPLPPGVGRTAEEIDADIREMREAGC
jgi:prevent-host-death family protein